MDAVFSEFELHKHMVHFREQWADSFNVKNKDSEVVAISTEWTRKYGYSNPIDMLGVTPKDLTIPTVDVADELIEQVSRSFRMRERKLYILLLMGFNSEIDPILCERSFVDGYVVSNQKIMNSGLFAQNFYEKIELIDRKYHRGMQSCYEVVDNYLDLSRRETDILHFLLLGMSSTEIANILSISNRTVQHTINRAKQKLNCDSSQQLIELGICLGLTRKIPSRFL